MLALLLAPDPGASMFQKKRTESGLCEVIGHSASSLGSCQIDALQRFHTIVLDAIDAQLVGDEALATCSWAELVMGPDWGVVLYLCLLEV